MFMPRACGYKEKPIFTKKLRPVSDGGGGEKLLALKSALLNMGPGRKPRPTRNTWWDTSRVYVVGLEVLKVGPI